MATEPTGSAGTLILTLSRGSGNAAARTYPVTILAQVKCASSLTFANDVPWTVQPRDLSSTFDISGVETVTVLNTVTTYQLNAAGDPLTVTQTFEIGATDTKGLAGPTSITTSVNLPALKVIPGVPTGVTATRVSDTSVTLHWAQSSASNGAPTSNTVQQRVNGGAWTTVATISPTTSTTVSAAANQKLEYRVRGNNTAGSSAYSSGSSPIFTTPAAPSGVAAAKNASANIVVSWTDNVAFTEHQHVVEHGVISGGTTTWDGSPLGTVAAGTTSFTHTSPNSAQVHVYRVHAKNTDTGGLTSATVMSNSVQLLAPPNKPTFGTVPTFADAAADLLIKWTHNPVDTTPQKFYEFGYSTDGGSTWNSTGKTTSTVSSYTIPASTYDAGDVVTIRVRTWGSATTGGSDSAGGSPYSDTKTVTFKSLPVASIVSPADSSTLTAAALNVVLGFVQAESATFVSATIQLSTDSTVVETLQSNTLDGTLMATRVQDGASYTLTVTVKDSNGLTSDPATADFDVDYLDPVTPILDATYLPDQGFAQLGVGIPDPGVQAAAVAITLTRTIGDTTETIVDTYPVDGSLTILDTTPVINGDNLYSVVTISADGAQSVPVTFTLTVAEPTWAWLSKGSGFMTTVRFGTNLSLEADPTVNQSLVAAAGRTRPIGLYGKTGGLVVSASADVFSFLNGSTPEDIEAFLLLPGACCYRDPSGRRVFGQVVGKITRASSRIASVNVTVTETS